jgi:flagellar biosynthesis chaperone FliJ
MRNIIDILTKNYQSVINLQNTFEVISYKNENPYFDILEKDIDKIGENIENIRNIIDNMITKIGDIELTEEAILITMEDNKKLEDINIDNKLEDINIDNKLEDINIDNKRDIIIKIKKLGSKAKEYYENLNDEFKNDVEIILNVLDQNPKTILSDENKEKIISIFN